MHLAAENCKLMNERGQLVCMLSKLEGFSLVKHKKAVKTGGRSFRLLSAPAPSNSHESNACLTKTDMECLAGLRKITPERRERLMGWGLLQPDMA